MARTQSEETVRKIRYVQGLLKNSDALTHRDLRSKVKDKFGTGLAFGIISAIKNGENPIAQPGKKAAKKKRGRPRKAGVSSGRRGRRGRGSLSGEPNFVLSIPSASVLQGFDRKADIRKEIAKQLTDGVDPGEISVYAKEDFSIETKHVVSF